jgi:hypothetical protein
LKENAMPRFVVRAEGPEWEALRADVAALSAIAAGAEVNLNDLARALGRVVAGVGAAFTRARLPSVRLAAAEKALDLKTGKSELEAFVGR